MKKDFWFYKFKEIFYKYFNLKLLFIIKFKQSFKCDEAIINKNNLRKYDFNFNQDLKDFY